ncbi:MAG: hypothetical protein LC754_10565 [Acidobacteria bacterium]|nr:hypothetical protein [Acidobacteriota bacterium]
MPQIEFSINEQTGELTMDIHGVVGPACDQIDKLVRSLTGAPDNVVLKDSYRQRPAVVRNQVRGGK